MTPIVAPAGSQGRPRGTLVAARDQLGDRPRDQPSRPVRVDSAQGARGAVAQPRPWQYTKLLISNNNNYLPNSRHQTAPKTDRQAAYQERRNTRLGLRWVLNRESSIPRVQRCGRRGNGRDQLCIRRQNGVAHVAGVQLCGSVWACPVCSARIRQTRATELQRACDWWLDRYGPRTVLMLTLTMPHDIGERLAPLLATIRAGFGAMVGGKGWQCDKDAYGVTHYVRAHDCTVGRAGWHPHFHVVLFGTRVLSDRERRALTTAMYRRWARAIERRGHRAPSRRHGIRVEVASTRRQLANYVTQVAGDADTSTATVALEVTRGDLKQSHHAGQRTPWQLLQSFGETGDCDELALWHEWERATKGVQAIRWSRGLKALVGIDTKTDTEIVSEEVGGDVVHTFTPVEWRAVCHVRGALGAVLRRVEHHDPGDLHRYLARVVAHWERRRRKDNYSVHGARRDAAA